MVIVPYFLPEIAMSGRHHWALTTLASIYSGWNRKGPSSVRSKCLSEYIHPGMMALAADAAGHSKQ